MKKPFRRMLLCGLAVVFFGVPFVLIMLARLFESNVLGWMFGFSLLLDVAIAFVGGVGLACRGIWRAVRPKRVDGQSLQATHKTKIEGDATEAGLQVMPTAMLAVRVDRDSVAAGDDTESHELTIPVDPAVTLLGFLQLVQRQRYLPSISGGKATWIVQSACAARQPLALCAQQWAEPKLLVADAPLASFFNAVQPALKFVYRCQVSPEVEYSTLLAGQMPGHGASDPDGRPSL